MRLENIASLFGISDIYEISEMKSGHINRTYLVTAASGRYILQSLNREVFACPNLVMENISKIEKAFLKLKGSIVSVPHYLSAGSANFLEADGEIWRMYGYMASEEHYDSNYYLMGISFGTFIKAINDTNMNLAAVIEDFHNFRKYYEKLISIAPEIAELFSSLVNNIDTVFTKSLPVRNVHNDAKADNVIIGSRCTVIDLDTAMRGYAALDYGDMIRSVCKGDVMDMTALIEVTRGFYKGLNGLLTNDEVNSLYYGILWTVGELSMRYYIDGVEKNGYFKGKSPEYCIRRGNELYAQLCVFMEREEEICKIIGKEFFRS